MGADPSLVAGRPAAAQSFRPAMPPQNRPRGPLASFPPRNVSAAKSPMNMPNTPFGLQAGAGRGSFFVPPTPAGAAGSPGPTPGGRGRVPSTPLDRRVAGRTPSGGLPTSPVTYPQR